MFWIMNVMKFWLPRGRIQIFQRVFFFFFFFFFCSPRPLRRWREYFVENNFGLSEKSHRKSNRDGCRWVQSRPFSHWFGFFFFFFFLNSSTLFQSATRSIETQCSAVPKKQTNKNNQTNKRTAVKPSRKSWSRSFIESWMELRCRHLLRGAINKIWKKNQFRQ